MHPRPQGHLLDRQDNSGPYAPWNCRWVTRQEQNSNRRSCFYVMDGDEHVTLKEYCRRYKLTYRCIVRRVSEWGWPIEKALRVPVGPIEIGSASCRERVCTYV